MGLPEILSRNEKDIAYFKRILYNILQLKSYKDIEIEARVGTITSVITRKRMSFKTEHPIVFSRLPNDYCFESGVEQKDYMKIKDIIVGSNKTENRSDIVVICNKIRRIESENEVVYEKKIRLNVIDLYLPDFKYDVRVSISREEKVDKKDFQSKHNAITRKRERESLCLGPFSFDFTKANKIMEQNANVFEIEAELKDPETGMADFISVVFNLPVIK